MMEYISSDTNVWIDFSTINKLQLPFLLPCVYLMNDDTVEYELLYPSGISDKLIALGLRKTSLSEEEFYLASKYIKKYKKPTLHDCIALAIAKVRNITLLTGDGALRKAAEAESVNVIGTIGILDRLYNGGYINHDEFTICISELKNITEEKFACQITSLPKD